MEVAERGAEEKCLVDSLEFSVLVLEFLWALKCFSRSASLTASPAGAGTSRHSLTLGVFARALAAPL